MAAVSMSMQSTGLDDSIFSLLDNSWYAQSILNLSIASSLRSEADGPNGTPSGVEECSTSQSTINGMNRSERKCSINESEMRRVFDRFDENGDGRICGEELRRYMSCCGKDLSDDEANSMISCVDHNKDGAVDFEEFLSLYRSLGSGDASGEHHERADAVVDEDEEALLGAFRVFDKNDDGFISAQELQAVLLSFGIPEGKCLTSCQKMIRNVDRDGDGQCDILEFREMMSAESF